MAPNPPSLSQVQAVHGGSCHSRCRSRADRSGGGREGDPERLLRSLIHSAGSVNCEQCQAPMSFLQGEAAGATCHPTKSVGLPDMDRLSATPLQQAHAAGQWTSPHTARRPEPTWLHAGTHLQASEGQRAAAALPLPCECASTHKGYTTLTAVEGLHWSPARGAKWPRLVLGARKRPRAGTETHVAASAGGGPVAPYPV